MFVAILDATEIEQQNSHQLINTSVAADNVISGFFNFFSRPDQTIALKEEILTLKSEVEELKVQQKQILELMNESLNDSTTQKNRIGDAEELQHILIRYGNNPDGMSALHYAIKLGDIRAVSLLLDNGADVNSVDKVAKDDPVTPLMMTAICDQFEIARMLISRGADINFEIPLRWNVSNNRYYAIHYAAEFGSGKLVSLLISNGAKLDKVAPDNLTAPLHTACKAGNFDAVVALVKGGANINATRSNGNITHWNFGTSLDWAAQELIYMYNPKNLDLVEFLVENGAIRSFHSGNEKLPCPVIQGFLQSKHR